MGQFFTPASIARFMTGLFEVPSPVVRVLDPGAGVGSLSAAFVAAACTSRKPPSIIKLSAYEIDPVLIPCLQETIELCGEAAAAVGIRLEAQVMPHDFLELGIRSVAASLFEDAPRDRFDCVVLNPPYRKIRAESRERRLLRRIGIETSNLYSAFLAVASQLLEPGGQLVAITPRSFCNGTYFEAFRRSFLSTVRFRRLHVFESRDQAFSDDGVLQENVIFRADRISDSDDVVVSSSEGPEAVAHIRTIPYDDLIRSGVHGSFIHIVPDAQGDSVQSRMRGLPATLPDLGVSVSTGRVVDFRVEEFLRAKVGPDSNPLIYPCHVRDGVVVWPGSKNKKPAALAADPRTDELLNPAGWYVLVKRFSAKEERRRVVAAVFDPHSLPSERIAFENHLNYYHVRGGGMASSLAKGLAAFLNSTLVDSYFRQFSGHTQVNAGDLRSLRYPSRIQLVGLGRRIGSTWPDPGEMDRLVNEVVPLA